MKLRIDAIISRIIKETRIESGLDISDDIIKEIITSQNENIKERIDNRQSTSVSAFGMFKIKPHKELYINNIEKLKAEHPELNRFEIKVINRRDMSKVVNDLSLKRSKKNFTTSHIQLNTVKIIKRDGS